MAIYHCHISNVSRGKGSSSCATYAYISGEKVYDERTQQTFSYARQERILETGTILPVSAPAEFADPKKMFNSIEQNLTADNARTAKKIEVALPNELPLEEQKQIVEDYIRNNLTSEGYAATYAIHGDKKKTGNTHAHIEVANRPINERGDWDGKSKKDYALDKAGKRIPVLEYQKNEKGKYLKDGDGNKIPVLDEKGQPKQKTDSRNRKQWKRIDVEVNPIDTRDFLFHLRKEWAVEVNKHLELSQQIDHRSNADRGIEDTATIHEGYAARAIEARGGVADRCEINREIRQENAERRQVQQELAAKQEELARLEKKERELHERLGKLLRRRENAEAVGRIADRERATTGESATVRAANPDNQTAREQAGRADRLRAIIERREREAADLRREREEATRAEREAAERKQQLVAERAKRQQQSRQPTKTATKSHEHTLAR